MRNYKKRVIIYIFAVLTVLTMLAGSILSKNLLLKKVLGFYHIENAISNNERFYVFIEYLDREIKLMCTEDEYNLVIVHRNDVFLIEFIYNELCPSTGNILTIEYDKYLSESLLNVKASSDLCPKKI